MRYLKFNKLDIKKIKCLWEYALLFLLAWIFMMQSPINMWRNADMDVDASVFKTVAMVMKNGGMPYRDTFDHKGPLLYFINYAGTLIASYSGEWVLEVLFLFITFVALYKTARLICNKTFSFAVILLISVNLFEYFGGGNYTEEFAMPFIAIGQYIFIDYFLNERITKLRLIICGLCLGAVLLLRPNMIAVWIVFCIAVLIKCIKQSDYSSLMTFLLWFVVGLLCILLPTCIWLILNGAWGDFWEQYITFNRIYSSAESGRGTFVNKWHSFFSYANSLTLLLSMLAAVHMTKENKWLGWSHLAYIILDLLFICIAGVEYEHYGMILVPMAAYPVAYFLKMCCGHLQDEKVAYAITILLVAMLAMPNWIYVVQGLAEQYDTREENKSSEYVSSVSAIIDSTCSEDEKITVYGTWNIIYVRSQRLPASKFSYQIPVCYICPEYMDEYFEDLEENLPAWVVIQAGRQDDRMTEFLETHGYQVYWADGAEQETAMYFRSGLL